MSEKYPDWLKNVMDSDLNTPCEENDPIEFAELSAIFKNSNNKINKQSVSIQKKNHNVSLLKELKSEITKKNDEYNNQKNLIKQKFLLRIKDIIIKTLNKMNIYFNIDNKNEIVNDIVSFFNEQYDNIAIIDDNEYCYRLHGYKKITLKFDNFVFDWLVGHIKDYDYINYTETYVNVYHNVRIQINDCYAKFGYLLSYYIGNEKYINALTNEFVLKIINESNSNSIVIPPRDIKNRFEQDRDKMAKLEQNKFNLKDNLRIIIEFFFGAIGISSFSIPLIAAFGYCINKDIKNSQQLEKEKLEEENRVLETTYPPFYHQSRNNKMK